MRRYCSRCLRAFGSADDPDRCIRPSCRRARPGDGWPSFLGYDDVLGDRFRVEEILGAGGAGITYRAWDDVRREAVAVKVVHPDRQHGVLARRLAIEGEVLEVLDHPHIVPFRALELDPRGPIFLATAYMEGGSLDAWLRAHGPLSPRGASSLALQLALALDYVHEGGIVHRDLKPGNVLLEVADADEPRVRLGDFGIARLYRSPRMVPGLTRTGAFIGTPEYAAPEQRRGERGVGPAADCFALGALLHHVAGGQPLHDREDVADWDAFKNKRWDPAHRPRLAELRDEPELVELDALIDALMHPEPSRRLDAAGLSVRLGAPSGILAARESLSFATPSLADQSHLELSGLQSLLGPDIDALVPSEDDEGFDEEADTELEIPRHEVLAELRTVWEEEDISAIAARVSLEASGQGDRAVVGPSPVSSREPRVGFLAPRPAASAIAPRPASASDLPMPVFGGITRDTSEDFDEDAASWPPPRIRRQRRRGALLVAACVLLGGLLAWPGGPAALVPQAARAEVERRAPGLLAALTVAEPSWVADAAPRQLRTVKRFVQQAAASLRPRSSQPVAFRAPDNAQPVASRAPQPDEPRTTRSTMPPAATQLAPAKAAEPSPGAVTASLAREPSADSSPPPSAGERFPAAPVAAPAAAPAAPAAAAAVIAPTRDRTGAPPPRRIDPPSPERPLAISPGKQPLAIPGSRTAGAASPARPSAVERWSADRSDTRELPEVLAAEQEVARRRYLEQLAEQQVQAELRARVHARKAAEQQARAAQKMERWTEAQREARELREDGQQGGSGGTAEDTPAGY